MRRLEQYRAAIFDLDGTLVDSMPIWQHLCRDWLLAQGKQPIDSLEQELAVMTLTQAAQYVAAGYGICLSPPRMIAEWQELALWQYQQTVPLKAGAAELLSELAARGLLLAVATSCFPAACEAVLCRYDLRRLFAQIIYSEELGKSKNQPEFWLACAARLQVEPAQCVVFEDLCAAGQGAQAAGMTFVAVHDADCPDWALMQKQAEHAVLSLGEFLA